MYKLQRIVVGTDFTEPANRALHWAAVHLAPEAAFTLAHVLEFPATPRFLQGISPTEGTFEAIARDAANRHLSDLAASLRPANISTQVCVGRPHAELARLATEAAADLVLVGPHGDRPRSWKWLGTTAERVARTAPSAVMVATNPGDRPPRHILVPVDDATITRSVLGWAAFLADRFDAEVTVLHVLSDAAVTHVASVAAAISRDPRASDRSVSEAMVTEGMRWLDAVSRAGINIRRARSSVSFGKPGDVILDAAGKENADLIVIGRRGTGTALPALMGSTASIVLHGARCPVLVVGDASAG